MKIGLDLDGCAYDFVANMRDYLVEHRGANPEKLPEPDRWAMWESWGMTPDAWRSAFDTAVRDKALFGGGTAYLYPGAVDAVKRWVKDGHDVVAITHRPDAARLITRKWLIEVGLPDLPVRFTGDKATVGVDVLVDDNVDYCLAVVKAGGRAVLVDRPWNRRWTLCEGHTVQVDNLPASRTGRLQRAHGWWHATDGGVVEMIDRLTIADACDEHAAQAAIVSREHDTVPLEDAVDCFIPPEWGPKLNGAEAKRTAVLERCESGEQRFIRDIGPTYVSDSPFPIDVTPVGHPGEVRVTSDTGGQKGSKPEQVAQIPPRFLLELGRVYAAGADKYPDAEPGRPNWSRGYAWSLSYNALHRHLAAMWAGEWSDPEDGLPHIVKVAWHAATLYTFHAEDLGVDDRPAYYEASA